MESNKRYDELLKKAHQTGEYNQVRHLPGWRDMRKSSAKDLYRMGKISVDLAIKYGVKIPDHLAAFEGGHVTVEQLIAAGVDIRRMDSYRKQQATKAGIAQEQEVKAERMKVVASVTVKSASGQVKVMAPKPVHKPTAHEVAVAVAVANAQAREKAKAAAAKVRERGYEVKLSAQEQAELLARLNAKSY